MTLKQPGNLFAFQTSYFSLFGGTSVTAVVGAIMAKLMTNALAQQYNWVGTATKQSFARLQLREVISGMICSQQ